MKSPRARYVEHAVGTDSAPVDAYAAGVNGLHKQAIEAAKVLVRPILAFLVRELFRVRREGITRKDGLKLLGIRERTFFEHIVQGIQNLRLVRWG